ncbi:hypothetical protein ABEB36_004594 [Hypothenemus hampei]|uniref:DUF4806 domain-containing protein n=1 Tax=Hypothenemus hampei TaxID=57062 RepID=A0ABD1F7J1_HYPHA
MYSVIEFNQNCGGGLGVINESWLTPRKKQTFWPPLKNQKLFNKCLANKAEADENWPIYDIERHYYRTSEETSDLQTEYEEPRKRKRIATRRFSSSSIDSEVNVVHQRPPRLEYKDSLIIKEYSKKLISIFKGRESVSELRERGSLSDCRTKQFDFISFEKKDNTASNDNTKEKFPIKFPVATFPTLDILEDFLTDKTNYSHLVEFLSSIGGKDSKAKTIRILKTVITDELAQNFNFFGKRGSKKAFITLKLCAVILDSVKQTSQITTAEIESFIKTWLKHAPGRIKVASNVSENASFQTSA